MAKKITVKEKPEEAHQTITPLPGPVTFDLVISRDIDIDGHDIKCGTSVGEITCNFGLPPEWITGCVGRFINAKVK